MDYKKWLDNAKYIIETKVEYNKRFELKFLFLEYEWNKLSHGEKSALGRFFSAEVSEEKIKNVVKVGEGKSKHNLYMKIKK